MPTSRRGYCRTRSGAFRRGWTECFVSSAEPPGSPLTALQAPGRGYLPPTTLDRPGTPSLRLYGLSLAARCKGELSGPVQPPSYQPFVRPWPEAGSRWVGTPFVPTPLGGCGAQRRARAVPLGAGTGPARSHAQPPLGGEHGEHGEDQPLPAASTAAPRARARRTHAKVSLRIQVFGAFLSANINMLSCGYPTFGAYIPTFGAYQEGLSRLLGRVPT